MHRFNLLLLAVSLNSTLLQAVSSSSNELFVKPAHDDDCLNQLPCFTFTEYIQNASSYFVSNTNVFFRPGRHIIYEYTQLIVEDISSLSLVGADRRMLEGGMLNTIIECLQEGGFVFRNVKFLHISDIEVVRCGWKLPASLISTLPPTPHARAALLMVNVYSMVLETVSIGESSGYGLLGVNILGNSSVTGCSFNYNMWRDGQGEIIYNGGQNESRPGGNALLVFNPEASNLCMEQDPEDQQVFQVTNCEFAHGVDASTWYKKGLHMHEYTLGGGSGLGFYLKGSVMCRFHQHLHVAILIQNSIFYSNAAPIGANALVIYSLLPRYDAFLTETDSVVHIKIGNCTFYNGTASQHGGGLAIMAVNVHGRGSQLLVEISDSGFFNNFGVSGGGMSYKVQGLGRSMFRSECNFVLQLQNSQFLRNVGGRGGGLQIETVSLTRTFFMTQPLRQFYEISISSSTFSRNVASKQGGSVDVLCGHADRDGLKRYKIGMDRRNKISFINCSLSGNRAKDGAGMHISECTRRSDVYGSLSSSCIVTEGTTVILWLINLNFMRNSASQYLEKSTSVLYIENVFRILLSDSVFRENNSTAVCINGSQMSFSGKLNITGNRGYNGGGIRLNCIPSMRVTVMYLQPDTHVYMTNNSALRYGGAISVRTECERANCFFQFHSPNQNAAFCSPQHNTANEVQCYHSQIIMENNKAGIAGDSLYGGDLETCRFWNAFLSPHIFWTIFRISGKQSPTDIGSPPYKVCFCNGSIETSKCTTEVEVHHIFKGQTFSVQAASTGQYNYASAAVVKTEVSESVELGIRQRVQELGRDCGRLWYSIKSSDNLVKLKLSISNVRYTPSVIHVAFLQCPLGFEEWGDPPRCDCTAVLRNIAALTCDIDTLTIHCPAGVWLGNYSGDIAVHTNCPLGYCKPQGSNVSLERLDGQCAFSHSGILCGACQPGLSLALGTSQCLQCSNMYLLLLVPFTVAGVALVFLLLKCNLTVSVGTINGLIFYANFIGVKQSIFFPTDSAIFLTRFLSVIIAWVNLDFGIETCFIKHMTANVKAWLQFLFPVYVWTLVGAMIIGSRYSTRVAKVTGSNAVPVLATLLLLSYAKLLRLVITIVSPITLTDRNGTPSLRWLQDGNVPFLQGAHIVLFTTALVTTVFYLVPFTLFVTLSPYLQAKSGLRVLRWVNKLKPLLDAYQGPYKDNFRYWTGMMLVVRIILFAVFASNTLGDPRVDLLAITVALFGIFVCFWTAGRPYKSRLMHIIESFYLLNLGIFTAATQFLKTSQASPEQQQNLACVMVGSAFAGFCVILGYHLYKLVRCRNRRILDYIFRQHRSKPQCQLADEQQHVEPPHPTVSVVDMSQLREPLLTETDCTH